MNHAICITKVFNDAFTLYKKNWKICLVIGAIVGGFWLIERKASNQISALTTFYKYELLQSKHAVALFTNTRDTVQYHLTFPFSYKEYAIFFTLLFVLLYGQLCLSNFFLLLYSRKTSPSLSESLVSLGTFARAFAAYLFVTLMLIVFTTVGAILMKVGDWFLLSMEHKMVMLAVYAACIVIPFLLSFALIRWCAVDGYPSVSQIIDNCFSITHNNKLKILAIGLLMHILSYILQFCFLRICFWPLVQLNVLHYGALIAVGLVIPLREAVWTSVYQQIK